MMTTTTAPEYDPNACLAAALDFGASLELSWQTMALIDVSSTNGPTSDPGQGIGNGRSRVSPATVAIIVVAALAVLVGAGWFWRRKSKSKMFSFQMNDATAVLPQSIAPAPSAARPVTTVVDGNTPSTFIPLQPINQTSQHVAVSISGSGPGPGPGPVGHRANSWSQGVPVSVDPIPVCVAYSNRTSLPYPVTSSTDGYHQALSMPTQQQQQQLPIIASSLSAAPYRSFVIPSSPIVTPSISSGRQPGDKEEFEQGQDRSLSHAEADSLPHLNPAVESSAGTSSIPGPSSSSSNALYSTTPGESFRSYRNSRPIQEMLSPTLANAQLILQQSQDHQRPR
ncbi:hypothetical protein BGX28_000777 [Mortierella sp. GBA30]|nr:hypothetical protein BGX28_000777 [Mortierella sp. GBA30]